MPRSRTPRSRRPVDGDPTEVAPNEPENLKARFDAAMRAAGPFEPAPVLALAVSGGRDSMALALLARNWAGVRRGSVIALIVDHGLRAESGREARAVQRRLAALDIRSHILRWRGHKPSSGIQDAARHARYALLTGWCRRHGALHLLLGHQADDQVETVAMRAAHGSGAVGLAAMPLVTERDGVRLVRPLLGIWRDELRAMLVRARVDWIDDPSNADPRFERVRLRQGQRTITARSRRRLLPEAAAHGAARARLDDAVADLLAHVEPMPEGWLRMPSDLLARAPQSVARAALARCLLAVGGHEFAPRGARLDRLSEELRQPSRFRGRTLGGCRIVPWRGSLVVCREVARRAGELAGAAPIRFLGQVKKRPAKVTALVRASGLPGPVIDALAVVTGARGRLDAIPGLGWRRPGAVPAGAPSARKTVWPLAPARFLPAGRVVLTGSQII